MHIKDSYDAPELTMSTPTKKLEVLFERLVKFDNMKDNGIDILTIVKFQGWEQLFNRLQGPVFYYMVREFWIHAKFSLFQVNSFVFGKKIVIFEKLIAKLISHDGYGIRCEQMVKNESKLADIFEVIFISRNHSRKIKDLHPKLRVWARILLGCVHHRRSINYFDYINGDQQYVLYYISTEKKVDLLTLLFQYLRDRMKETREGSRKMKIWIPLGMMISDILMERKLIDSLTEDQITKELKPRVGKMFNVKGLKNLGIIPEAISPHDETPKEDIYNKRIPLEYFPIFSKLNPLDVVIGFMENCHASSILADSKTTSNEKRKVAKKHYERIAKKFKAARENLDTSDE